MAYSISSVVGLPSKYSASSGHGLPPSSSARASAGDCPLKERHSAFLPRNPVVIYKKSVYTSI
jgi:hypothetical protein